MLKLPKGLKKKKKGKKSKRKGEDELFTEEELEKYRREHQQQQAAAGEGSTKENEEWSKFQDLTKGIDSVLKQTQGDLDRIKSTSFFQRIPTGAKNVDRSGKEREGEKAESPKKPVVEITEADFPQLVAAAAAEADEDRSDYGATDEESEEDDQDDIFDTSYVDAVERGEVKLAYVPDSPEEPDDDIFDTSHVDAIIKGRDGKSSKGKDGKKSLDIGVAVEVLTGRIHNVTTTSKRSKRVIPGDLLLESTDSETKPVVSKLPSPTVEKSILDADEDELPISSPIDLSVSLHTLLIQQNKPCEEYLNNFEHENNSKVNDAEDDEFTQLATESFEVSGEVIKLREEEIKVEPVIQDSWSAFEADKNASVFAESIVEDQIDVFDPYLDGDDPFDTSFADEIIPSLNLDLVAKQTVILEDDDDFDPRAEEFQSRLNNRRKSSVRIHLTDPSGIRESITSDDVVVKETPLFHDLLGGSATDLTQLGDSPIDPVDINTEDDIDPFDTSIVDKIAAPGKVELKLLEKELIEEQKVQPIYRVPSDPDFDPRAEETDSPKVESRRASRPENLVVSKSVVFDVDGETEQSLDVKVKQQKPVTPYYTREVSITEDLNEEAEDSFPETLTRTRSDEELAPKATQQTKRRHSEFAQPKQSKVTLRASELLEIGQTNISTKVLTPCAPQPTKEEEDDFDPFDTSFAAQIAPSKIELRLLAKEFSCEETKVETEPDLLEPHDDIFQVKALTPEPTASNRVPEEDIDPFDTSFATDLQPGPTELKLLESEFLK